MKVIKLNMVNGDFLFYSTVDIRQGENLASQFQITLSDEFKGYNYDIIFQLNTLTPILVTPLTAVDGVITLDISNALTEESGTLRAELQAFDTITGALVKSAIARMRVKPSILGEGLVMPEQYVPWVTVINQAAITATTQAGLAEASAVEAARQAGLAAGHATTAGESETEATRQAGIATAQAGIAGGRATTAGEQAAIASGHATTASQQAGIASGHATTASQQAGIAAGHATTATTKAGEANTSAIAAAGSAGTASTAAQTATDKAAEAVATLAGTVKKTQKVNGTALSGDITVAASAVPVTPAGGISATNVQGALEELDGEKADKSTTYTKTEVDGKDALKADKSTTYTKTENDTAMALKADKATTYTKTEVDTKDATKADKATTYTKTETDNALALKVDKVTGKGLSTEDYTTAEKGKVTNLPADTATALAGKALAPLNGALQTVDEKNQHYPVLASLGGTTLIRHLAKRWHSNSSWSSIDSIGIGPNAMRSSNSSNSVGIGNNASEFTSGTMGVGIGHYAMQNNSAESCVGIGPYAMQNNNQHYCNGFGFRAMANNAVLYSNGVGYCAMQNNVGLSSNGFGYYAMQNNTGSNSIGIGPLTLMYNQVANNTAVGRDAYSGFLTNTAGEKICPSSNIDITLGRATIIGHGFGANNDVVNVKYSATTETAIGGLTVGLIYQVKIIDAATLEFVAGSQKQTLTSQGTGDHTFTPQFAYTNTTCLGAYTTPNKSNQVVLGNSSVDTIKMGGKERTPASATATGVKGETCWDANYFYVCVATNTWKRTPLSTW